MSGEITYYDLDTHEYLILEQHNGVISFFTNDSGRIDVYLNTKGITVKTEESATITPIVGNMIKIGNSKP